MNIFIGGPFDGQHFQNENYTSNEFKVSDLNLYKSTIYLRNEIEKNGLKYTFWIPEQAEKEYAFSRMSDILRNKS
ncbi:hypothetical protein [Acinetobacter beijerinckii]|uniref:Uncharacterized protein n=1 Tax=Acinetobacter beijerinckii ANC 3835 TaxID=1217649 RepID=N9E4U5_9GAMM|nr:hypothetical protein [Acinetobacter beijerinckii]ENW05162.1 hypothetical protein F934_01894 [Acinetobacter beijerinckii ANC 3835]MDF2417339.1 hypothetical protein [Acinetobacter beijerinckii]